MRNLALRERLLLITSSLLGSITSMTLNFGLNSSGIIGKDASSFFTVLFSLKISLQILSSNE